MCQLCSTVDLGQSSSLWEPGGGIRKVKESTLCSSPEVRPLHLHMEGEARIFLRRQLRVFG